MGNNNTIQQQEKEQEEEQEEEEEEEINDNAVVEEENNIIIDPKQSLFDRRISSSVEENIHYMYEKYGFFVPDKEYLIDAEGFLGYCQEKIKLGHYCLYCHSIFSTYRGCQQHMINKRHCKLK